MYSFSHNRNSPLPIEKTGGYCLQNAIILPIDKNSHTKTVRVQPAQHTHTHILVHTGSLPLIAAAAVIQRHMVILFILLNLTFTVTTCAIKIQSLHLLE